MKAAWMGGFFDCGDLLALERGLVALLGGFLALK
jgi:hypothetical protein